MYTAVGEEARSPHILIRIICLSRRLLYFIINDLVQALLFPICKVLLLSGKQANYTSLNPYTLRLLWQFLKKKLTEIDEYSIKLIYPRLHISHFVFITSFYYSIRQYHCLNILNSRHLHSNNSSIDL